MQIRSLIRQAFVPKRDFRTNEEIVPAKANLLQIEKLVSPIEVTDDSHFYPSQKEVKEVLQWDNHAADAPLAPEVQAAMKYWKHKEWIPHRYTRMTHTPNVGRPIITFPTVSTALWRENISHNPSCP